MAEEEASSPREPYPEAGLCDRCHHAEIVRSKRSRFLRCRLADSDDRFAKYPRLPVVACEGFVRPFPDATR